MYKIYRHLPDLLTLGNLFCGCAAIVFFLQSGELFITTGNFEERMVHLPEQMWWGCLFIAIAMVFDFLDGFVARLLKVNSALGVQLDSLADMVSFGVAPSMILYVFLRLSFMQSDNALTTSWLLLTPAFFVACASAYRLALFNLDTRQHVRHFIGMPTPAMTVLVTGLPFLFWFDYWGISVLLLNKWFLYALIFLLCYLMNAKIYFFSLKLQRGGLRANTLPILAVLCFIILILIFGWLAIAMMWCVYLLACVFFQKRLARSLEISDKAKGEKSF